MAKKPHRLIPQILAAALTLFGVALCSTPSSTYNNLGNVKSVLGKYEEALVDL